MEIINQPWDFALPGPHVSLFLACTLVFTLAIAWFLISYDASFVFDDSEAILNIKDLQPEMPLLVLFHHDFCGLKLASHTSHKSYRPLTVLTFRLNYYLAGGFCPLGFHITNNLLHASVCVVLLYVLCQLLGFLQIKQCVSLKLTTPKSAFWITVLFVIHPIHTESVAGVVGRADLLCALMFLISFIFCIKACYAGKFEPLYL